MPELVFNVAGAQKVTAAYNAAKKGAEDAAKGVDKITSATKLQADEIKKVDALQQQIVKRNESAGAKYIRQLGETRKALAGHRNEAELLRKETTRLTIDFLRQSDQSKRATLSQTDAQKRLNSEVGKLAPLFDRSAQEAAQWGDSVQAAGNELGTFHKKLDKTSESIDGAFGDAAIDKIAGLATPILGLLGPIKLVTAGFDDLKSRIDRGAADVAATATSEGELKQLADNQQEYDKLLGVVDRLQVGGAVGSREEAIQTTFSLASGEQLDEPTLRTFERLGQRQVVKDLGSLAKSSATVTSSFGKDEVGGQVPLLSKAFAAAKRSPGSVEQVLEAVAQVGPAASGEGISDEEVFAGVSTLAKAIGSPADAGTALESFIFSSAAVPELAGKSLQERVKFFKDKNLGSADLLKTLGRKEAVRGFSKLAKEDAAYTVNLRDVQAANTNTAALDEKLSISSPVATAQRLADTIRQVNDVKNREEGVASTLYGQIYDRTKDQVREKLGDGLVGSTAIGLENAMQTVGDWFRGPSRLDRLNEQLKLEEGRGQLGDQGVLTGEEEQTIRELNESKRIQEKQLESLKSQQSDASKQTAALQSIDRQMQLGGGMLVGFS